MKTFLRTATASGVAAATLVSGLALGPAAFAAESSTHALSPIVASTEISSVGVLSAYLTDRNDLYGSVPYFGVATTSDCQTVRNWFKGWRNGTAPYGGTGTWDINGLEPGSTHIFYGCERVSGAVYPSTRFSITVPRKFTASTSYDAATDAFTVSGRTTSSSPTMQVSTDGGSSWQTVGSASGYQYSIELDRQYTAGTSLSVREGETGSGASVPLHDSALTDVSIGQHAHERTLTAKAGRGGATVHVSQGDTAGEDYQTLTAGSDGWVRDVVLDHVPSSTSTATIWEGDRGQRTRVELPSVLAASVASTDVAAGTAVLSGTALPGAWIEIDGAAQDRVQADAEGRWTYTLTGLPFGTSTHTVKQFDGADLAGETSVEVDLAVSPLTVAASFQEKIDDPALLSGTAHPGASIDVTNASGTVIGRTMADDAGDWSMPVPAPDAPGAYKVTVEQKVGDRAAGTQDATIEYGDTVAISVPEDGYDVEPGKALTMTGTGEKHADGEPAAKVKVFEKGKAHDILGTADVSKLGNWQLRTPVLEDREYTLVVQQTGRGGNLTSSEVTVNEGKRPGVEQPFTQASPVEGDVLIAPDNRVTFSGTGTTGDDVTITNPYNGRVIATTTVDEKGAWTATGTLGYNAQNVKTVATHADGTTTEQTIRVFVYPTGVETPFVQDTPKDRDTILAPDNEVSFAGKASTGDKIRVLNPATGRVIGAATVGANGQWEFVGSVGFHWQHLRTEVTHAGTTTNHDITVFVTKGTEQDFAQTAPLTGQTLVAPDNAVTFSGVGTTGDTVVVTNTYNGREVGRATVDGKGDWTIQGKLGHAWQNLSTTVTHADGSTDEVKITIKVVAS